MEMGVLLEVVGNWIVSEYLVTPGVEVDLVVASYCASHRSHVLTGCFSRLMTMPLDRVRQGTKWTGLGYHLRRRGYRGGWVIVGSDAPRTILSVADHWRESQQQPGVWSVALPDLGEKLFDTGRYRKFPDAPRVKVTPVGDHALVRWGSTKRIDVPSEEMQRPYPRSGPFVDVLAGANSLSGRPVRDLADACDLFGVRLTRTTRNPIDRLRAEVVAINDLYQRLVAEVTTMELGIDLSKLVSTGGVATALLRAMEPSRDE
jgi:hypothetical protein